MNFRIATEQFAPAQQPVSQASHLPGFVYHDPRILAMEKECLFGNAWLYAGRVEQLAHPGDYFTLRLLDEPVVVVKNRSGEIRAFSNVCLHRGTEVALGSGNTKRFSCPYHAWTYDLDGRLVGTIRMEDSVGFDSAQCRLPAIRVGTWEGNIFVTFNEHAPDLDVYLKDADADLGFLRMGRLALGGTQRVVLNCNWKLMVENLADMYHVKVLHRNTNGRFFSYDSLNFQTRDNGSYYVEYDSGPNVGGEPLLGVIPWLADRPKKFSASGFISPNVTVFCRVDIVRVITTWPIGVDKCELVDHTLFTPETVARPDFDDKLKQYQAVIAATLDEDRTMVESLQNGVRSARFAPGRLSTTETAVHELIKHWSRELIEKGR